jgi:hypothetical protein
VYRHGQTPLGETKVGRVLFDDEQAICTPQWERSVDSVIVIPVNIQCGELDCLDTIGAGRFRSCQSCLQCLTTCSA